MIAVLSLTLALMWPGDGVGHLDTGGSVVSADRGALAAIPVAVFAPADITDSLVSRICAEAEAIWKPAGIAFEWHRVTSTDAVRGWWLHVTIDERPNDLHRGRAALGWVPFTADGPRPAIYLSRSNVEALLVRTPGVEDMTISTHETLLGRALGRALSHEIGHYLLQSKVHTPHGLMRAVRSAAEFFGTTRHGFELSTEERHAAALRLLPVRPTD
jgi:hypothetical protein